ncbi:MAG: DnaD domain protein [Clostridia bacterium]|nr:DnaD domain protein [Clostridia bacterium]
MKQNMTAWFMESGFVGIPKNLLGLMEPLGLSFDDLGKIVYLLYCGVDQVKKTDSYARDAAKTLEKKGLINWFPDMERVDFSPMFNLIAEKLGDDPVYVETAAASEEEFSYSDLVKNLEKKLGRFLSVKEKIEIQKVAQRYDWPLNLVQEMYMFYQTNYRRQYAFSFFAQMAFGAKVDNLDSFGKFIENLNYTTYKVVEVKRRLGQKNYPTEVEKECYLKWVNEWKFTHEMVLLAVEETIYATDPSFKYIDTVLENWHKQGIDTPEKLKLHKLEREKEKEKEREKEKKTPNTTRIGQAVYGKIRDLDDLVE